MAAPVRAQQFFAEIVPNTSVVATEKQNLLKEYDAIYQIISVEPKDIRFIRICEISIKVFNSHAQKTLDSSITSLTSEAQNAVSPEKKDSILKSIEKIITIRAQISENHVQIKSILAKESASLVEILNEYAKNHTINKVFTLINSKDPLTPLQKKTKQHKTQPPISTAGEKQTGVETTDPQSSSTNESIPSEKSPPAIVTPHQTKLSTMIPPISTAGEKQTAAETTETQSSANDSVSSAKTQFETLHDLIVKINTSLIKKCNGQLEAAKKIDLKDESALDTVKTLIKEQKKLALYHHGFINNVIKEWGLEEEAGHAIVPVNAKQLPANPAHGSGIGVINMANWKPAVQPLNMTLPISSAKQITNQPYAAPGSMMIDNLNTNKLTIINNFYNYPTNAKLPVSQPPPTFIKTPSFINTSPTISPLSTKPSANLPISILANSDEIMNLNLKRENDSDSCAEQPPKKQKSGR